MLSSPGEVSGDEGADRHEHHDDHDNDDRMEVFGSVRFDGRVKNLIEMVKLGQKVGTKIR